MRKTFGYHAYKNGVSLELLMDIFNHSTQAMTLRYIGITESQKREVICNLTFDKKCIPIFTNIPFRGDRQKHPG